MSEITYDDHNLQRLFEKLGDKEREKAIKGALRREANKTRIVAVRNLRSSLRSNTELERGVRAKVFRRAAGFRVTVGSKAKKARNKGKKNDARRYGKDKPVLVWAEDGTKKRSTKTQTKIWTRSRRGHNTGFMRRYGFMDKTRRETADTITEDMRKEIVESVIKTARKYGCT